MSSNELTILYSFLDIVNSDKSTTQYFGPYVCVLSYYGQQFEIIVCFTISCLAYDEIVESDNAFQTQIGTSTENPIDIITRPEIKKGINAVHNASRIEYQVLHMEADCPNLG